ncbi:chemotaxis protein CheX [Pseudoxanthomonas koreensis]|uniref:chemotaxis protein CheX n=1 Tax=Pseudoxanthomonas koreensis TaxID=266061 RepID=UPI001390D1E0|nr:chemotaxis protein CheX [Pseudoxanthomonas koreensis]KAF1690436.1 chemotaxis protein CheX [Pseudoxanthomonas koreensis]
MPVKFLGQFLLERGVITAEQLQAATAAQRASNLLLGELAVREGLLDAAQAQRINERQRSDDRRFGDIAMELGLLEPAQVEALLARQKAARKLFGEVLVEQGALDPARLQAELAAHHADQDAASHALAVSVADHTLAEFASGVIGLCARLLPRLLDSPCQAAGLLDAGALSAYPCVAHVQLEGEQPLYIGLACDRDTMHAMARAFLRIGPERCGDALALDGLGEIASVLAGYALRQVLPDDGRYLPAPPDTTTPAVALATDRDRSLAVLMNAQAGPFVLLLGTG